MHYLFDWTNAVPVVVQAVLLLIIGWIVAGIIRSVTKKVLNRWFLKRVESGPDEIKSSYGETVDLAGNIAFAVIFFLFLPSALEKLGISSVTEPISAVVSKFLIFLPNLIAAAILIAFGAFLAKLLAGILDAALKKTPIDGLQKKGGIEVKEGYEFSAIISKLAYAIILVVFVVAGVQVLNIAAISGPATEMVNMVFMYIPLLFAAIILILFGIFLGKLVGNLVSTVLAGTGIDKFSRETYQGNNEKAVMASTIIGTVVTVVIDIIFVVAGVRVLGIEVLTNVGNAIIGYMPSVLAACLVLLAAWAAGAWLQKTIIKTYPDASALAMIVRVVVMVIAGFMALGQLGVSTDIVKTLFTWMCIGLAVAFGIAFGMGGQTWAKDRLEDLTKSAQDQTKKKVD